MNFRIFFLSFCILPTLGFAADHHSSFHLLTPSPTDASIAYLGSIFGVVNDVLHGTGSQILGKMFGIFNSVILCFAGVVWGYAGLVGIVNTSTEGEFLGKKWSSIWIPLRIVSGTALLVPTATTGYSIIQTLVMYIVIQGVGAAGGVWNAALDYLQNNGTIVEPVKSVRGGAGAADNSFLIQVAGNILKSETCVVCLNNLLANEDVKAPSLIESIKINAADNSISFPSKPAGNIYRDYTGFCGKLSWEPLSPQSAPLTTAAINHIVWSLAPLAQTLGNIIVPPKTMSATLNPDNRRLLNDLALYLSPGALLNTASDFYAIVKPALRETKILKNKIAEKERKQFINNAKKDGWIMAGSYYHELAKLNAWARNVDTALKIDQNKLGHQFTPHYDQLDIGNSNHIQNLKEKLPISDGKIDSYIANECSTQVYDPNSNSKLFNKINEKNNTRLLDVNLNIRGKIIHIVDPFLGPFTRATNHFQEQMESILAQNVDPIVALAMIGNNLVNMVETAWASLLASLVAVSLSLVSIGFVSTLFAGGPINAMLSLLGFLSIFLPILILWMTINITIGATLAYYVPMIPFFLFFFGALSWFAFVIEAMIAAPLIALGILHPEGHDFLGKAEQAMMLLVSIFLRPILMIFGFIFGIILCTIAFSLFNYGYGIAIQAVNDLNKEWLGFASSTAMMVIYSTTSVTIVTRSFSMIYEVPNKVLRWVGGPQENESAQALAQIESGVTRQIEQVGAQVSGKAFATTEKQFSGAASEGRRSGASYGSSSQNSGRITATTTPPADNTNS